MVVLSIYSLVDACLGDAGLDKTRPSRSKWWGDPNEYKPDKRESLPEYGIKLHDHLLNRSKNWVKRLKKPYYEYKPPISNNSQVWDFCLSLLQSLSEYDVEFKVSLNRLYTAAEGMSAARSSYECDQVYKLSDHSRQAFVCLKSLREDLYRVQSRLASTREMRRRHERRIYKGLPAPKTEKAYEASGGKKGKVYASSGPFRLCGTRNIFYLRSKIKGKVTYASVTRLAFHRIPEFLDSLANTLFCIDDLKMSCRPLTFLLRLLKTTKACTRGDIERSGECIKAARNCIVAGLDKDRALGTDMEVEMLKTMSGWKGSAGSRIARLIRSSFTQDLDHVNISHIYKLVPQPDVSMKDSFDTVQGLKDPNKVEKGAYSALKGVMKRAAAQSLLDQGKVVRMVQGFGDRGVIEGCNSDTGPPKDVLAINTDRWTDVKFEKVRDVPGPREVAVKLGDKASGPNPCMSVRDMVEVSERVKRLYREDAVPFDLKAFRNVKDVLTALRGTDRLNPETAWMHFDKVIEAHEAFENELSEGGTQLEDISSEQLSSFLLANPHFLYWVSTEIKAGEKHKAIPRLFYMAEQKLKILTQTTEKVTRSIFGKQQGVSITKSQRDRQADLEFMEHSMSTSAPGTKPWFLSFDMSEFSKKFPHELLRMFGEILSDITGEPSLRRIDLFFRSSVVLQSSRRYFDHMHGIKGCFEGFLNFVWSSIHACIMELALRDCNYQGVLLTYSDDGLLRLELPRDLDMVQVKNVVLRIKKTYEQCGLVFHLGKMIISTNVWEYLGDICYSGSLIPLWMKEVSSYGIREDTPGFTPRKDVVGMYGSQAGAAVKAGLPGHKGELLAMYDTMISIVRLCPKVSPYDAGLLTILPYSAGGVRVPGRFEMSFYSSLSTYSHFRAELLMMSESSSKRCADLLSYIIPRISSDRRAVESIMTGTFLKTDTPDMTGISTARQLVSKIVTKTRGTCPLSPDPMTPARKKAIESLIRDLRKIDISVISEIMSSIPEIKLFNDSMALVKSRSAVTFLGRDEIRSAQKSDSRNFIKGLMMFVRRPKSHAGYSVSDLDTSILSRTFKGFSVSTPKFSPVGLMRFSRKKGWSPGQSSTTRIADTGPISLFGQVLVSIDEWEEKKRLTFSGIPHTPQSSISRDPVTALAWDSHVARSTKERYDEVMRKVLASCLSAFPKMAGFLSFFPMVFGYPRFYINPQAAGKLTRLRAYAGKRTDVMNLVPTVVTSRTNLIKPIPYNMAVNMELFTDRTTYAKGFEALVGLKLLSDGLLSMPAVGDTVLRSYYLRDDFVRFVSDADMFWKDYGDPYVQATPRYLDEFSRGTKERDMKQLIETDRMVEEEVKMRIIRASMYSSVGYDHDEGKELISNVESVVASQAAKWIVKMMDARNSPGAIALSKIVIVPSYRVDLVTSVLEQALWLTYKKDVEQLKYKYRSKGKSKPGKSQRITIGDEDKMMEQASDRLKHFVSAMRDFIPEGTFPSQLAYRLLVRDTAIVEGAWKLVRAPDLSVFSGRRSLVTSKVKFGRDVTNSDVAHHFKETVSATMQKIYSMGHKLNWDKDEMKRRMKGIKDPDDILNLSAVYLDHIRRSAHRNINDPANRKVIRAKLFLMGRCLDSVEQYLDRGGYFDTKQEAEDFIRRWEPDEKDSEEAYESFCRGEGEQPDLRRHCGEGLHKMSVSRLVIIALIQSRTGRRHRCSVPRGARDVYGAATAYYEQILTKIASTIKIVTYNQYYTASTTMSETRRRKPPGIQASRPSLPRLCEKVSDLNSEESRIIALCVAETLDQHGYVPIAPHSQIPGIAMLERLGLTNHKSDEGGKAYHNVYSGPGLRTFCVRGDELVGLSLKEFAVDVLASYSSALVIVDDGKFTTVYGAAYIPHDEEGEELEWGLQVEPEEGQDLYDKVDLAQEITFPGTSLAICALNSNLGLTMSGDAIEPQYYSPLVAAASLENIRGSETAGAICTESPALQAASSLISARKSEKSDIIAHVCLMSFLSGEDDDYDLIQQRCHEWDQMIEGARGYVRAGMMSAVQSSVSYLEAFRYSASTVRSNEANRVIRLAEQFPGRTRRVVRTRIMRLANALSPNEFMSLRGTLSYDDLSSGMIDLSELLSSQEQ